MKLTFALAPLVVLVARGQEADVRRVEARVTAVAGSVVYLDQGSDAGIEPGDRARVMSGASGGVELVARSTSRASSRFEFSATPSPLAIGDLVEVLVPASRAAAAATEHPPWTHPTEEWSSDVPLLAPAKVPTPAERARELEGRWFAGWNATFDHQGDEQRYEMWRTGLDARLENAFGAGDVLRLDAEFFARSGDDQNSYSEDRTRTRVDRFSWRLGDWRTHPDRIEIGRFLHSELPQLGVVDGVEYVRRTEGGDRWGASVGLLPSWDDELQTGDDLEAALFYRLLGGDKGEVSLGGALQKTWHRGESDRDALLGDFSWRPNEHWWVASSAWFDYYDGDDDPKSSGVELTELFANVLWRSSGAWGMGASAAHVRWPVTKRNDLPATTLETLADGVVDRVSVNSWHDLTKLTRLSLRADAWESQDDDGTGGEVRLARRDLLWEQGELAVALFLQTGQYSDVSGVRLSANRWSTLGTWSLWYELSEHDQEDYGGNVQDPTQQVLRGTWDGTIGRLWSFGVFGEAYFGDEQDAESVGFQLQRRF